MATSDVQAPASSEPFGSLAELRKEHAALMQAARDTVRTRSHPNDGAGRIRRFLDRAQATGRNIDEPEDRDAAQGILDYWTATLLTFTESVSAFPGPVVLAPFDATHVPDLSDKPCPFMGLSAFREADADRFFGRDEAVQALLAKVKQQPTVLVVGPSGSGKSSLVLAGLVPKLRAGDWWCPPVVVPGGDPLGRLLEALCPQGTEPRTWVPARRPELERRPEFLRDLAENAAGGRPLALVIDQAEELLTLCDDQRARERFAEAIVGLTSGSGTRHRVILTVREDFLKELLQLPALRPLADDPEARFSPPPLAPRELWRVIERPAEMVGLKFDDGIVADLVKEVSGEPTALPLLQFTLMKLWENRERNRISWDAYRRVGSPREALKRTADAVYERLIQEDRQAAERIFLELVQPAAGAEFVRRRLRRDALTHLEAPDRVNRVLDRLVEAGLLLRTPGTVAEDDRFEVAHEALIRNWPRLGGWLGQSRERMHQQVRLAATARLWRESGRKDGYLLTGTALTEAARHVDASPEIRELVEASTSRQRSRYRWAAVFFAALAAAALAVAAVAWTGWMEAGQQRKAAESALTTVRDQNVRLRLSQDALRDQTMTAEREKKAAQEARDTVAEKQVLTNVGLMTRTLAEVASAPTPADHDIAVHRWRAFTSRVASDEYLSVLRQFDAEQLLHQAESANRNKLSQDTIRRIRQLRNPAIDNPQVYPSLNSMRWVAYDMVELCAERTVSTLGQGKPFSEAQPYVTGFWTLYWGEMILVEGPQVEDTMVKWGRALADIEQEVVQKPSDEMTKKLKELERRIPPAQAKQFADLAVRVTPSTYSQIQQQFKEIPASDVGQLFKEATARRVAPERVKHLRELLQPLVQALRKEREHRIQKYTDATGL